MGNVFSTDLARGDATANVTSESETMSDASASYEDAEDFHDTIDDDEARVKAKEEEMIEFRKQLDIKREQRKVILARHRAEKEKLEESLENERKSNMEQKNNNRMLRELLIQNNIAIPENLTSNELTELTGAIANMKEEFEKLRSNNNKLRGELAETSVSLQNAYSDIADLNAQNMESMKHINALKDVITVSKTMITLREQQLIELKNKLDEIEQSLADREANMLSADLKQEYERQLQNIRTLRGLYEERARLAEVTRQSLVREVEEQKSLKEAEIKKNEDLSSKIAELEATVNTLEESIDNKKDQITSFQDETRVLKEEMTAVNMLFSQVLLGYKNKQDLDKLVHRLEENHGILTHMAEREHGSEASSALPKLLLEIVSQVDETEDNNQIEAGIQDAIKEKTDDDNENTKLAASAIDTQNPSNTSAEEIVQNLPKVWRVLMELLSHQSEAEAVISEKVETCYKTVETKAGSVLVPSVSQTYIRLKDLILEKLALIKEVNRMKQLNGHLETRLGEQERRLSLVTTELSKTWHVVGRLRRHHHQLHTHEKILKYELQQKRKLLNELKDELEYCREKWEQAREKNSQSERDWRKLRAEFTSRKNSPSFNNSGESGYSDERPSDDSSESNDESEYVTEPKVRCKKKNKKSVEAVLDSSADFNSVAEREDPVSDMLDVAELPLDTQDDTSGLEVSVSISNNSDNVPKNAEETEDEVGEITNDSCNDDSSGVEHYCNSDYCCVGTSVDQDGPSDSKLMSSDNKSKQTSSDRPTIDPAAILKSIKEQTERLAKKDEKLNNLEKNCVKLLKKTQETDKLSKQIDSTLDHLLNRPTTSQRQGTEESTFIAKDAPVSKVADIKYNVQPQNDDSAINTNNKPVTELETCAKTPVGEECATQIKFFAHENKESSLIETNENISISALVNNLPSCSDTPNNLPVINASSILESIELQNDRLAKKDERLQRLENDCSEVMTSVSNVLKVSEDISAKLDDLHDKHGNGSEEADAFEVNVIPENRGTPEPSTSTEMDHEARFAARDIRLKRLEEQTKSLVNRVNKTTSKGVKIHYKLEELHNIYGSESSRAGTPSDENEEKPQNNDDNAEE